jgi:monoamine oxidase
VSNWSGDEFTLGSYSYESVNAKKFRALAGKPVANTLFFVGEYMGEPAGTVEGALSSATK